MISATSAISPKVIDNMAEMVGIMLPMESATLGLPDASSRPNSTDGQDLRVVVGIGGNQGDVVATFRRALSALRVQFPDLRISPLYRTDPIGPPKPDYLNAGILLSTVDDLEQLLEALHQLEAQADRKREVRWGPRTLDLDILWASNRILDSSTLTVPHPHLRARGFALLPLLDLVPDACDPIRLTPYAELISTEFLRSTRRVSEGSWWEAPSCP